MNKKVLNYNEIGINPKLRRDYQNLKKSQLKCACDNLAQLINNPVNVYYYEMSLKGVR